MTPEAGIPILIKETMFRNLSQIHSEFVSGYRRSNFSSRPLLLMIALVFLALGVFSMLAGSIMERSPFGGEKLIRNEGDQFLYEPQRGQASWYGPGFHGRPTASQEIYDQTDWTAAHKHLPLGTVVRVTNLENGRRAIIRINDRGPYVEDRILDLSRRAARYLGLRDKGVGMVRIEVLRYPAGGIK